MLRSEARGLPLLKVPIAVLLFFALFSTADVVAQPFTMLQVDAELTWVQGVSWIDYDNDGDLDLFTSNNDFGGVSTFNPDRNRNKLFRNDGDDSFVEVTPAAISSQVSFSGGQTWADIDNDGDLDFFSSNKNYIYEAFLSENPVEGSALFRNDGPFAYNFTRVTSGDINSNNRISAFASAWADYNNDGFVDLVITTPRTVAYPTGDTLTNVLFDNNGDGTFSRNTSSAVVNGPIDFYTIPAWSDYDQDGDMDLFITNGPIQNGVRQADYVWVNQLMETGQATFVRDLTTNFASESRDGQQASWIDFDNDGDLDLYVTNFGGTPGGGPGSTSGTPNDFYRNNGDGSYTKIDTGPQSGDSKISFGQTWGDFDNDGDLDLYVTNFTSFNSTGGNDYYENQGYPDYQFVRTDLGRLTSIGRAGWSASSGDYDNDGDLDLYVTVNSLTGGAARDELHRNDLSSSASWINIECTGVQSNRSAIGTRISAKATVDGNDIWQLREISAQNAATGQNSLRVHFGFGDAEVIDSLVIRWPSGVEDIYEQVAVRQFVEATEGVGIGPVTVGSSDEESVPRGIKLNANFPNPFETSTTLEYELPTTSSVDFSIHDLLGRRVATIVDGTMQRAGVHRATFSGGTLPSGVYIAKMKVGNTILTRKLSLLK